MDISYRLMNPTGDRGPAAGHREEYTNRLLALALAERHAPALTVLVCAFRQNTRTSPFGGMVIKGRRALLLSTSHS